MSKNTALKREPLNEEIDMEISRVVDVPREKLWKAWTTPELITRWFAPAPWTAAEAEVDLRPGGKFFVTMRSSEGEDMPCSGCFLEIVPNEKLVWTDALHADFRPSGAPFMTAVVTLEDHKDGTLYMARVLHKDAEDRNKHEAMGFYEGWHKCLDQLVEVAKAI